MFRRRARKRDEAERAEQPEATTEEERTEPAAPTPPEDAGPTSMYRAQGPWDSAEDAPELPRLDLGSLRIPQVRGLQLALSGDRQGQRFTGVMLAAGQIRLLVPPPLAAPKTSGIWAEVREEIVAAAAENGGQAKEFEGTFGPELRVFRPTPGKTNEQGQQLGTLERHIGVDGPRWLLRGVISGPGLRDPKATVLIETVFQGIVVDRGDRPAPPKTPLELRLTPQAREVLAQARQAAAKTAANGSGTTPAPGAAGDEAPGAGDTDSDDTGGEPKA